MRFSGFDNDYRKSTLGDIFEYERPDKYIVLSEKYHNEYSTPVLTANQAFILGYTNETEGIYDKGPVILFDDFTCDMKFADFPFKVKSSAMKLLTPKSETPIFYAYSLLQHINYQPKGHARHWISIMQPIPVMMPDNAEQKKISDFLILVNAKIEKQRKLIENLKKYKRGLNIRLLSGISMSYSKRLGDVCSIIGGGTPDTTTAKFWDGGINWFTPSEIGKTKYVVSSVRSISYDGMLKSSAKLLPQNTVLLTTRATLGEMSILHAEATTNQGFQSLIPSNELLAEYVYYLQVIIKPWCEKYASGNTFREISKSALSNCVIPVPDISIQNKIVRVLSGIDQHIERENDILDKLREQKKALLQQLFI